MRGKRVTGWRRIATAMWPSPQDPQIYGAMDLDARPVLRFITRCRAAGHHVTPTHVVGRALAHALVAVPDLNVQMRRGRARPRPSVDIFFITAVKQGSDLSGVKIVDVPNRSAVEVANQLAARSGALKAGKDPDLAKSKTLMDRTPPRLLRGALRATAFLANDLGIDVPMLGLRASPFGSAMITSVGMFGLPSGFAPLSWMYDVPVLLLVGEIAKRPVITDGKVEPGDVLPISATIDHRYVDGWHVSEAMKAFREYLAAPERFEPAAGLHAA